MNLIKKPTTLLMGGHAGEGRLIISDEWQVTGIGLFGSIVCKRGLPQREGSF